MEATLYFSYYVHRALIEAGLGDSYIEQLGPWRHVLEQGLTTLPETPKEDSRSDSHAWGSHPVYHMLSNICGIQALEPGFKAVRIAPSLGPLEFARGSVPHPLGTIEVDFKREADGGISGQIVLPEGLGGIFVWGEEAIELRPGSQSVSL